jgi:hypothetical protein
MFPLGNGTSETAAFSERRDRKSQLVTRSCHEAYIAEGPGIVNSGGLHRRCALGRRKLLIRLDGQAAADAFEFGRRGAGEEAAGAPDVDELAGLDRP